MMTKTTTAATLLTTAMLLAGCVSAEERQKMTQMQADADKLQCTSYGFAVGTDGYAKCRLAIDLARQQADQIAAAQANQAMANAVQQAGQQAGQAFQQPPPLYHPPPITPSCADGYPCAGRTLQGDGLWH